MSRFVVERPLERLQQYFARVCPYSLLELLTVILAAISSICLAPGVKQKPLAAPVLLTPLPQIFLPRSHRSSL